MLVTHFFDGARSQECAVNSAMSKAPMVDKSIEGHIHISETEVVTKIDVLHNLHRMGSALFNNPFSTNTCLHVKDGEGETATFWVHDFYFAHDSPVLFRTLHRSPHLNTPMLEDLEQFHPSQEQTTIDGTGKWHIHLSVPSVDGFEELLRWIYTHDDDAWLQTMNESNFDSVMKNVAYLRLSQDAYYVMAEFYENI